MSKYDKSSLSSKKFVAYLLASIGSKLVILATLMHPGPIVWTWAFLAATMVVDGFITVSYIGKQADLDRYVRLAEIGMRNTSHITPTTEDDKT